MSCMIEIKRGLRRRSAIEPVIGHLKAEHRRGRKRLTHGAGDAINGSPSARFRPTCLRRHTAEHHHAAHGDRGKNHDHGSDV